MTSQERKPKVIEIDCNKWQKIIGITLWCGATIGLGIAIYELNNFISFEPNESCFITYETNSDGKQQNIPTCVPDHSFAFIVLWFLGLGGNGLNYFMIWKVFNDHYKWIIIRCKN